jgi:hypothetical protein
MTAVPNIRSSSATQGSATGLLGAWLDALLYRVFVLTRGAARLRKYFFWMMFLGYLGFLVLRTTPFQAWAKPFGGLFDALLSTRAEPLARVTSIVSFIGFLLGACLNLSVLRDIIPVLFPYWLGRQVASIYQADIFEKEFGVARRFIMQAAFASRYNVISISQGRVVDEDQISPVVQIGGPGFVQVELDSVILTEKADGTPRVIGPTGSERSQMAVLDGFERLRQGVDLRDRDDSGSFTFRSRDGIPIGAKDVRWTYSINRGERPSQRTLPYPFDESAVSSQVYRPARPVPTQTKFDAKADWQKALPGRIGAMVGATLNNFISTHGLGEFLASIDEPELEALRERQVLIKQESEKIAGEQQTAAAGPKADDLDGEKPNKFVTRDFITALFSGDAFKKAAKERGVQLRWIGVGTWDPHARIPDDHVQAWGISRENLARGNPINLQKRRGDARLQELRYIIQEFPLSTYYQHKEAGKPAKSIVQKLLADYYERLRWARQLYERGHVDVPLALVNAIQALDDLRAEKQWGEHWIGDEDEPLG